MDRYHKLYVYCNDSYAIIHAAHKDDDEFLQRVKAQIANCYSAEDAIVSVMIEDNMGRAWAERVKSKLVQQFPVLEVSFYTTTHASKAEEAGP